MLILKQAGAVVFSLVLATSAFALQAPEQTSATTSAAPSPQELQQLVAPIALYPDALVAQVLAASTYPTQVVEAARFVQSNSALKGEQLAAAVDKQPWDDSVKGLTQFPDVLQNMSQNLSWTSALGDAYFNNGDAVMSAIQGLRADAQNAGNLQSTPQQTVTTQGQNIIIQPADPQVVYVPQYSPAVYGTPVESYPGYSGWGVAAASALSFGVGTAIGAAAGGWGWGHWGADWHGGDVTFNRNAYVSRSNTFANRNAAYGRYGQANRAGAYRGGAYGGGNLAARSNLPANRAAGAQARSYAGGAQARNFAGGAQARNYAGGQAMRERSNSQLSRGFGQGGASSLGTRSNAFGGFSQGGSARLASARGSSSFSGARGGARAGGGGFHGGGGRGGGGRGGGGRR
jgi:hypothetical protein